MTEIRGRVCFTPFRLAAEHSDDWRARFAGFPVKMTFARVLNGVDTSEQPPIVGANYWFDSDTFVENKETREMMYYSRAPNRYSVRVVQHKNAGAWEVFKYRDEELLFRAYGRTFKEAMLYAAWPGSEEDETDELGVWDPWGI